MSPYCLGRDFDASCYSRKNSLPSVGSDIRLVAIWDIENEAVRYFLDFLSETVPRQAGKSYHQKDILSNKSEVAFAYLNNFIKFRWTKNWRIII